MAMPVDHGFPSLGKKGEESRPSPEKKFSKTQVRFTGMKGMNGIWSKVITATSGPGLTTRSLLSLKDTKSTKDNLCPNQPSKSVNTRFQVLSAVIRVQQMPLL
jgi:hypothetical protein